MLEKKGAVQAKADKKKVGRERSGQKRKLLNLLTPKGRMRPSAVKRGIDHLPYGIAFARRNGIVILCNYVMHTISHTLCGETLQNSNVFWAAVTKQESLENGYLIHLKNGEKWLLHRCEGTLYGQPIFEFHANNVTEQARLTDKLREENEQLKQFSERMRQLNRNALDLTARKELLERKAHTHDELGRLLQATRAFLFSGGTDEETLWERWHINAGLMLEETRLPHDVDPMESLYEVADSIGVKVTVTGSLPDDTEVAELFFAACGESLTNMMRHARGTELYVSIETDNDVCKVTLTNDGERPNGEIAEGGGLSSLRQRIESAGGAMIVSSEPEYKLFLILHKRRNAYYDTHIDR